MWIQCLALCPNSAQPSRSSPILSCLMSQLMLCQNCLLTQLLPLHSPASEPFFFHRYHAQEQSGIDFLHATLCLSVCFLGTQPMIVGARSGLRNQMLGWDFGAGSLAPQLAMGTSTHQTVPGTRQLCTCEHVDWRWIGKVFLWERMFSKVPCLGNMGNGTLRIMKLGSSC